MEDQKLDCSLRVWTLSTFWAQAALDHLESSVKIPLSQEGKLERVQEENWGEFWGTFWLFDN